MVSNKMFTEVHKAELELLLSSQWLMKTNENETI